MMQLFLLAGLILTGCVLYARDGVKEEREVKGFDKIAFSLSCDLEIKQGNAEDILIEGDEKDIPKVVTEVKDGTLQIKRKKGTTSNFKDMKVIVTVKELKELSVAGSGDVNFTTALKADNLSIKLSGSSDVSCENLVADQLDVKVAGSGDVKLGGELASDLEIRLSGSGDIKAHDLKAKTARVSIAGSGDISVWATEFLESRVAGSGDIKYKGDPKVDSKVSGSGDIKAI